MNGYIMNKSNTWMHALKRAVRPGGKIPLDELYEQYGKKYNLAEGKDFVDWLRRIKLKDPERWLIQFEEAPTEGLTPLTEEIKQSLTTEIQDEVSVERDTMPDKPLKSINIQDIVELSVRNARDLLPRITDLKLLKYSLQEASVRSGKDSLCRELRRRIKQLEVGRGH